MSKKISDNQSKVEEIATKSGAGRKEKAAWSCFVGPAGEDGPRLYVPKQKRAVGHVDVAATTIEAAREAAGDAADAIVPSPDNGRVSCRVSFKGPNALLAFERLIAAVAAGTLPTVGKRKRGEAAPPKPSRLVVEVKPREPAEEEEGAEPTLEPEAAAQAEELKSAAIDRLAAARARVSERRAEEASAAALEAAEPELEEPESEIEE